MAAASFLVIIMTGQLYMASTPRAAAYMTIDINPSIELAVSKDGVVVSGSGLHSGQAVYKEGVLAESITYSVDDRGRISS